MGIFDKYDEKTFGRMTKHLISATFDKNDLGIQKLKSKKMSDKEIAERAKIAEKLRKKK